MKLALVVSHPIQYYAPLFRELARQLDLEVFFAHSATPQQQAAAGFGTPFEWDIDLLSGFSSTFLRNASREPGSHHFRGCDTPDIGEVLARGKFDVVLTLGWHLKAYWQAIIAAKRLGLAVLTRGDSHLETPRSNVKRIAKAGLYPLVLRAFDAVLYVGARNRAYYEFYRYPKNRMFFSPHCVDTQRFAAGATLDARDAARTRFALQEDDKLALFAGKLVAFKRPLDVIEAVAMKRNAGTQLHIAIAGSGPLEKAMRERADALGVPLHIMGFQNQTQMPAAYAAADLLVLPSTGRETWGLACNEALACGTPIVVSDAIGCAPDLAIDGSVGRRFPMGDVRALADAIADTLAAPPSRIAIQAVSDRHSLAAATTGIIQAVEFCLKKGKASYQR